MCTYINYLDMLINIEKKKHHGVNLSDSKLIFRTCVDNLRSSNANTTIFVYMYVCGNLKFSKKTICVVIYISTCIANIYINQYIRCDMVFDMGKYIYEKHKHTKYICNCIHTHNYTSITSK